MQLAIDPGLDTGWALYEDYTLKACGLGEFPKGYFQKAIIECPQVYAARLSKGNPNDLITLALQVGRYQERLEAFGVPTRLVKPAEWKGQVPKEIHHARVLKELSGSELDILEKATKSIAKSKKHNVLDAVALGLWAFGKKK